MSMTDTQSLDFNGNEQGKNKLFQTQLKTIFEYLKNNTATASMVAEATGVPQKSICRYKRDLEKQGLLYEVEKRHCKITGFRAYYLTTNQDKMPKSNQTKLF
jgi:DNA-binding MarR family transcriptional regulator